MTNRAYQYETSPKKLKPDYNKPKTQTKKIVKKVNNKKVKVKERWKLKTTVLFAFIFLVLFIIIYRNSMINESFSKIQSLKSEITEIQKENDQLEIAIQNSLNLNNIEQSAKELIGMQKLTNKQTVYISLSKKDYVEPKIEDVVLEENIGLISSIIEKIKNIF